jgi:hypothetical protein
VQVEEQLGVGVAAGEQMGRVHRQRGLADPGHSVDGRDHDRVRRHSFQMPQFGAAAGEFVGVVRQVAAWQILGRSRAGHRAAGQDLPMAFLQGGGWVDAELLREP